MFTYALHAELLSLPVEHMAALARSWGGVPRRLLRCFDNNIHDNDIKREYCNAAEVAVQRCRVTISSTVEKNLVEEGPSRFYFCRPKKIGTKIVRVHASSYVPTPTLRCLLGEALQRYQAGFLPHSESTQRDSFVGARPVSSFVVTYVIPFLSLYPLP